MRCFLGNTCPGGVFVVTVLVRIMAIPSHLLSVWPTVLMERLQLPGSPLGASSKEPSPQVGSEDPGQIRIPDDVVDRHVRAETKAGHRKWCQGRGGRWSGEGLSDSDMWPEVNEDIASPGWGSVCCPRNSKGASVAEPAPVKGERAKGPLSTREAGPCLFCAIGSRVWGTAPAPLQVLIQPSRDVWVTTVTDISRCLSVLVYVTLKAAMWGMFVPSLCKGNDSFRLRPQ